MGRRGRFGKYGECKRVERLRRPRTDPFVLFRERPSSRAAAGPGWNKELQEKRIRIRPACPSDVEYIRGLSRRAFSLFGPYEEILTRWFESGVTRSVLALLGETPAGFIMLGPSWSGPYPRSASELLAIAVEPGVRRQGIGDLLVREAEKMAKALEVSRLVLFTALENSAARRLFIRHGFVPVEVRKAFYPRGQDAMMMEREIP